MSCRDSICLKTKVNSFGIDSNTLESLSQTGPQVENANIQCVKSIEKLINDNNIIELQLFAKTGKIAMRNQEKQVRDEEFTPKDIRKRVCYRKISEEIKNYMARLYYVQNVKMSKLVKKYNISFSTITDILKKYDHNGQRITKPSQSRNNSRKSQDSTLTPIKLEHQKEVKIQQLDPQSLLQMESPHNPEYVFYDN